MTRKSGSALVLAAFLAAAGAIASRPAFAQEDVEAPGDEMAPPPPPAEDDVPPPQQPASAMQPPAQPPTQQTFDQTLSPYGRWVDTPEYGRVWVPSGVGQDWQPYTDGQWVDTTYGWSFQASVPWGWATYHYGRWGYRGGMGWFWVPGFRWAPAWVAWRHSNGYAAWSPLGPRGYVYPRAWPGWVVVPHAHFTAPIRRWAVPSHQVGVIVRSAVPVRGFASVRYGPVQRVTPSRRDVRRQH